MRTIFTVDDVKNLIEHIYNGNLTLYKISPTTVEYDNPNDETVILIDEDTNQQTAVSLAQYLDVHFYTWKKRMEEKGGWYGDVNTYSEWLTSLSDTLNTTIAGVEVVDETVAVSQDIDNATILGAVTFLCPTNKINNLDYYACKLRNVYMGVPQQIQNSFGENITAFILLGKPTYEEGVIETQIGECVVAKCGFSINYLSSALSYADTKMEISLDGDDKYDASGNIIGETKYLEMPLTKVSWQNIFSTTAVPTSQRPDLTGVVATAISKSATLSFYDFNKELTSRFTDLFWTLSAISKNGKATTVSDVNIPIYLRVTTNGNSYVYKDLITAIAKTITNGEFNVTSLTVNGWGKVQSEQEG